MCVPLQQDETEMQMLANETLRRSPNRSFTIKEQENMELICRIIEQHPLQKRDYTDRNGQPQTFNSVGFVLANGVDTLYAELTGEQAVNLGTYATDCYYKAELSLRTDRWTDQQGCTRYGTRAYINRLSIL